MLQFTEKCPVLPLDDEHSVFKKCIPVEAFKRLITINLVLVAKLIYQSVHKN